MRGGAYDGRRSGIEVEGQDGGIVREILHHLGRREGSAV